MYTYRFYVYTYIYTYVCTYIYAQRYLHIYTKILTYIYTQRYYALRYTNHVHICLYIMRERERDLRWLLQAFPDREVVSSKRG